MNEQKCSYCDTMFMLQAGKPGKIDVCPDCYVEYGPFCEGTKEEWKESWKVFEQNPADRDSGFDD